MKRSHSQSRRTNTKGFTVLELIVALTLGLVLLSAIWTMFRIFLRHEEVETAQVEKLQIVSSLHQHLSQELLNLFPAGNTGPAVPLPSSPKVILPLPGGSAPGFPFPLPNQFGGIAADELLAQSERNREPSLNLSANSLVGDATRLELTVFAAFDDFDSEQPPNNPQSTFTVDVQDKPPRTPSKKVTYEFVAPKNQFDSLENPALNDDLENTDTEEESGSASSRVGLWRRESVASTGAREPPDKSLGPNSLDSDFGQQSIKEPISRENDRRVEAERIDFQSNSQVEEFAPEIIDLQFDYFDGRKWKSSWDSRNANQLPVMVRVRIAVETRERLRERKLEERVEKTFSQSRNSDQEDEVNSPLTRRSTRINPTEPLDPNWDYQFLLFVSPPPPSVSGVAEASTENRIKSTDRTNNRSKNTGGASR